MPSTPQPELIFLSYSRNDRAAAIALRSALEQAGLPVFQDEDTIRVGDRWVMRLQDALQGCGAFLLLVGRDGVRRWVGAEVQVALIRHLSSHDEASRLPIFPVLLEDAQPDDLPPFLALFQTERWSPNTPVPTALLDAIQTRTIRFDVPPVFEGCPFLGLHAFGRGDARLFFGRRQETLMALASLGDQSESNPEGLHGDGGAAYHRWLQIEGNSGAGKSSLVNAGMLPMIEQGALWARTGYEHWRVLGPMLPGKDPLAKLAEVLEHGLIAEPAQRNSMGRLQQLEQDERALALALRNVKQDRSAFLLVVDQFEELFTFAEDQSRQRFDALLAQALQDPECPLFLISTIRADFLDRFERLSHLQAIYNSHCKRYFLPTISAPGLREVIEQPACLAGLDVREVTAAILNDARDEIGALPLVENALYTLWQQRKGNRLSGEHYRQANGIAGLLSAQADALLERIDRAVPKGRQAALELLLRLTRIHDEGRHTRQRITRDEAVLVAGGGQDAVGERVVQQLSGERPLDVPVSTHNGALRLITTSVEQDRRYVDLIHETLIRARGKDEKTGQRVGYWPTLYAYIEANRDRDLHRQQLQLQTEHWSQSQGLGRVWHLAGWGSLGRYRRLRVPQNSLEGRFLFWSRWATRVQLVVLVLAIGFVAESFLWTRKHDLPLDSMLTQQRFRLGHAPLPEFVAIPAGAFAMGEQNQEFVKQLQERYMPNFGVPGRSIEITQGFRLSKHEVTYDQYDYYVWERQRQGDNDPKYPTTAKGGRGTRPVVYITWHEATAYTQWLSARLHQNCRLPTEAEWEYAARAGTHTAYPWGDKVGQNKANCNGCGNPWDNDQSAPVGSFLANAWGLHDTSGNVWEWTCSAWREQFDGNEQQCIDPKSSGIRVIRSGSWFSDPADVRSAGRVYYLPGGRFNNLGFRVWCSSPIKITGH
ncbi:MAG: SUMF1/EgtB/PvdO family nonheme iron enzyme [Phycisphaerales bacterium]|nr:SUMF1/EgtB/PvdO family nonheme iron enzyme [Phycisphaerales bacterium]